MSWKYVSIGECIESTSNCNPAVAFGDDPFDYIDISSVNRNTKKVEEASSIAGTNAPSRARQIVAINDVIVSTVRPNLNGVALITEKYYGAIASTGYCVLRPKKDLLYSKYLFYWVTTNTFIEEMMKLATGANYPAVSDRIVKQSLILLPPLEEQKRIAQVLDKADRLRQKDRQLLAHYDQLLQSVFLDMFGDPVKNEKGWESGTIRDIITEAKYGTSKPAESEGEYPYLRMNNLTYSGAMDFSDLKYINLEEKEKEKYLVKKGDLLFNRTNSKELVGKTAVYRSDSEMAIAGYLIRVRTNDRANTDYISGYLNSLHGKETLRGMCKSIVGMANINAQELQDIKILIPPVKLQNEYSAIVDKLEGMKLTVSKSIGKSETLFQSLLQKAFKGELQLKEEEVV